VDSSATTSVVVNDTTDTTTITLVGDTVDEGGSATVTANVDNAPQGSPLVITLSNGEVTPPPVRLLPGPGTFAVQGDDPYLDGETIPLSISTATGGNYEDV